MPDNRLPTNQSQIDIEAALQDVKTAIANLNFILDAQNIAYDSNTSVKNKIDSKIGLSLYGSYTKSADVEVGYYPINKPFIATVYGSGVVVSMFCANRSNLGKFLYLDSTHRVYFNNAGTFGLGDVENGTTVEVYQID